MCGGPEDDLSSFVLMTAQTKATQGRNDLSRLTTQGYIQSIMVGKSRWQEREAAAHTITISKQLGMCATTRFTFSPLYTDQGGGLTHSRLFVPHQMMYIIKAILHSRDQTRLQLTPDSVNWQHYCRCCSSGGIHFLDQGLSLAWDFLSRLGWFKLRPSELFTVLALRILMWKPCLRLICWNT